MLNIGIIFFNKEKFKPSPACGEPPIALSTGALLANKQALESARQDLFGAKDFIPVGELFEMLHIKLHHAKHEGFLWQFHSSKCHCGHVTFTLLASKIDTLCFLVFSTIRFCQIDISLLECPLFFPICCVQHHQILPNRLFFVEMSSVLPNFLHPGSVRTLEQWYCCF